MELNKLNLPPSLHFLFCSSLLEKQKKTQRKQQRAAGIGKNKFNNMTLFRFYFSIQILLKTIRKFSKNRDFCEKDT